MKQRIFITLLALTCMVLTTQAQALSDRYNDNRKAVIVSDNNDYVKIAKAVAKQIDIPCEFKKLTENQAVNALALGQADVAIISTKQVPATYNASKCIIGYSLISADTLGAVRFVGKDRQLIEQLDDAYMRLRQEGQIADIQDQHLSQMEIDEAEKEAEALEIADVLIVLAVIFVILSLLILWHIRSTRRHTKEVKEMIKQTEQMHKCYEVEDNQAAHDLKHKYDAILENPYLAIAFFDKKGKTIAENKAMKQLGSKNYVVQRQPLYNAKGEVANYFVAVRLNEPTA